LQLINAGKVRRIRTPSTLQALDLLLETDLLESDTHRNLKEAYIFFRTTEHCIQINHQLQTHELPRTQEEQQELARRMGYRDNALPRFLTDLDGHRKAVEELFSGLFFHSGEDFLQNVSPATRAIIQAIPSEESTAAVLGQYGLGILADAYPVLKGLILPAENKLPSEKGRSLLQRLAPLFVEELLKVPEPRQALVALDSFIDSLSAHAAYLSTLLENPPTVGFLMSILGESRFFTELLVHHPQAIDSLIARSGQEFPRSQAALEHDLAERLRFCDDFESELDVLRRFKNEQILTIGVHHLSEEIDSCVARRLTSELAEACLAAAVEIAEREMVRKFGGGLFEEGVPFVILGMGKLGGREMTYLSDVDVIFIYDYAEPEIGRFGSHEWFTRLANRIISILSVPTAEGTVFAIDTRLRPSGQKGPLVSSLASFRDYHGTTSKLWEKQALIKARPITGPPWLASEVAVIVRDCLLRTRVSAEDLQEIHRLRKRMENELALEDELHVDLKTGHGGLVDVEFFVQAHILKYAADHPSIVVPNTLEALNELYAEGLIDEASFQTLDHGYRFLSNLEDRLRTMEYRSVNRMPLKGDKLTGLARRLGYGEHGEERFLEDYFRVTASVRGIYDAFFVEGSE
jgi:[glutamine synthetase] adenylyltransferase / [glutamine synthetase]-adenylyl-L-tyrosine phosphorylase